MSHPSYLQMIQTAISSTRDNGQGIKRLTISNYIQKNYNGLASGSRFETAITKGLQQGINKQLLQYDDKRYKCDNQRYKIHKRKQTEEHDKKINDRLNMIENELQNNPYFKRIQGNNYATAKRARDVRYYDRLICTLCNKIITEYGGRSYRYQHEGNISRHLTSPQHKQRLKQMKQDKAMTNSQIKHITYNNKVKTSHQTDKRSLNEMLNGNNTNSNSDYSMKKRKLNDNKIEKPNLSQNESLLNGMSNDNNMNSNSSYRKVNNDKNENISDEEVVITDEIIIKKEIKPDHEPNIDELMSGLECDNNNNVMDNEVLFVSEKKKENNANSVIELAFADDFGTIVKFCPKCFAIAHRTDKDIKEKCSVMTCKQCGDDKNYTYWCWDCSNILSIEHLSFNPDTNEPAGAHRKCRGKKRNKCIKTETSCLSI